jgi:hypothetical protein
MSVEMIATKDLKYRTRRLKAGDGFRVKNSREAKVLAHLGRAEMAANANREVALDDARAQVALPPLSKDSTDIGTLRAQYAEKFGKRPFNGWSAAQLQEKLAAE